MLGDMAIQRMDHVSVVVDDLAAAGTEPDNATATGSATSAAPRASSSRWRSSPADGWTTSLRRPILNGMREVPGADDAEWVERLRALARQDAEEMVPRPDFPVFGVSAPRLEPAALAAYEQVNGSWAAVTLAYGAGDAAAGPYVAVSSGRAEPELAALTAGAPGRGPEARLLRAIDAERDRLAASTGVDEDEPAGPPRYSREELPAGAALVARHGTVWAARLDRAAGVTVTITGRGVDPDEVRLSRVSDLRPLFEARNEILGRLAERRRREPPPVLEPAEGVAAFRALADFELEGHARIRAAAWPGGRMLRQPANWGRLRSALWQRAVSEQQRVGGVAKGAADDVVTSVMNHLGHLAEQAPWFTADPRLRAAAVDETLRHAVLGEAVPSLPAQQAWRRYWSDHLGRALRLDGGGSAFAETQTRRALTDGWLAAWTTWTETA